MVVLDIWCETSKKDLRFISCWRLIKKRTNVVSQIREMTAVYEMDFYCRKKI